MNFEQTIALDKSIVKYAMSMVTRTQRACMYMLHRTENGSAFRYVSAHKCRHTNTHTHTHVHTHTQHVLTSLIPSY